MVTPHLLFLGGKWMMFRSHRLTLVVALWIASCSLARGNIVVDSLYQEVGTSGSGGGVANNFDLPPIDLSVTTLEVIPPSASQDLTYIGPITFGAATPDLELKIQN